MKTAIVKGWDWLLGIVMGILGFSGCGKIIVTPDEYGCPYADYKLVGDVKDVRKNPIPGIRVVLDRIPDEEVGENAEFQKDTLYTDANGHFGKDLPDDYWAETYTVKFEDVDGTENGSYRTKVISGNEIVKERTKEGKGWYEGAFTIHADATLEEDNL